jgi:hypothetical protein
MDRKGYRPYLIGVAAGAVLVFLGLSMATNHNCRRLTPSQISSIVVDALSVRSASLNSQSDLVCPVSVNVYVCAGYCPWSNLVSKKLVSCTFIPRVPHPDFVRYGIYCTPHPDHCPTYNAWLKDKLPPTLQHIKKIPDHLLSNFTLNYSISVDYDAHQFRATDTYPANWTVSLISALQGKVRAREAFGSYRNKDIYPALDKYASLAIRDKKCAVIGTEMPWIEAALLEYNASRVVTIEYATIYSTVPRLFTITPEVFAQEQETGGDQRQLFDSIWSYSSIEHDGLGRYRDPLNPYGDLQTMAKLTCILRPGGFLFLSVPLNVRDHIAFNLHRLYGPIRLPLLYRHFQIVEVLGWKMSKQRGYADSQPFVVLQNKLGCE